MITTDAGLVAAAAAGDRGAFAEIHERHVDAVHDHLVRWCRDPALAADATQEAFVSLLHNLDRIRDGQAVRAWLMRTGRNRAVDQLRRTRRERTTTFDDRAIAGAAVVIDTDPDATPAVAAERSEAARLVWEVAQGLDRRTFSVLDLHVRQGLSGADLAEALGTSRGNADVLVHRMKQRMRTLFGAVLLLPAARDDCEQLSLIVDRVGEPLELAGAREVESHAEDCATCGPRQRRAVAPLRAYGALADVRAPDSVRRAISEAADVAFHPPDGGTRRGRRAALVGAAAVLLVGVGATATLDGTAEQEVPVAVTSPTPDEPTATTTGPDDAADDTGPPSPVGDEPSTDGDNPSTGPTAGGGSTATGPPTADEPATTTGSGTSTTTPTTTPTPTANPDDPSPDDPTRPDDPSPSPSRTPSPFPTFTFTPLPSPTFTFTPVPAPTFTFSPSPVPTFTFSPAPIPQPIP